MNYNFLRGKIVEKFGTIENYAKELGISRQILSKKLSNEVSFTQGQIFKSMELLGLTPEEVVKAFLTANWVVKKQLLWLIYLYYLSQLMTTRMYAKLLVAKQLKPIK